MKSYTLLFLICCSTFSLFAQIENRCTADSLLAPFYHGVASGDPTANSVLLWTRITLPDDENPEVSWEVATDTVFTTVVASGMVTTNAAQDFCIHADVSGLAANTWYYYRFNYAGFYSLTGRTKTLPVGDIDSLRFAIISCASLNAGYFNVYDIITRRNDFDAVIFLGDYIYEYESDGYGFNGAIDRPYEPESEIISLSDYRTRHSQYKLDEQLRVLHQNFPFICLWDDHEFADNAYNDGAVNHQPLAEGDWHERVAAAESAYFDWMPVRRSDDTLHPNKTYRSFNMGNLVDLFVLDTRIDDRTKQLDYLAANWDDTSRHIISLTQRNWLFEGLKNSTAQWKIIGQQVMMAPLTAVGVPINDDQWDGYPQDQEAVLQFLRDSIANNKVILTGDIHSSWANDVATPSYDAGAHSGSAAVEFVGPSVTSPSMELGWAEDVIQLMNEHIKFIDIEHRGFLMLDVTKEKTQGDYYFINNINTLDTNHNYDDGWMILNGNNWLYHADTATVRAANKIIPLAPGCPAAPDTATIGIQQFNMIIMGVYPNPLSDVLTMQYVLFENTPVWISIYDVSGNLIFTDRFNQVSGLHIYKSNLENLPAGNYQLTLKTNKGAISKAIIKM